MAEQKKLNIQIPEDLEPTYSNMIQIAHSDDEFSLRFIQRVQGTKMAKAKSSKMVAKLRRNSPNFKTEYKEHRTAGIIGV